MLLMAGMVTVASWRVRDDQSRHQSLERSARTVAALEQAHTTFFEEIAIVAALVWVRDPGLATLYGGAVEELKQDLSLAQREALAAGDSRLTARLGFLMQRITRLDQQLGPIAPALLGPDPDEAIDIALAGMGPAQSETYLIRDVLENLVAEEQKEFAAKRAAADHSADVTLMLVTAFGAVALVGGIATIVTLMALVVQPLASLRKSVRAITSGDLQTRAEVSGPEEVTSLAQDFNEMVSARRLVEEALHEQARRDPLTGVLNHGAVVEELRNLMSSGDEGTSHVVAMVDVDGLKAINDTYGHQVGDAVLLAAAGALSRDGVLVGRYGGDEFVALLPGADRDAAERYREGVLATLADVDLRDPETAARVPIVVSVGLAIYPTEAGRIEDLIKLADSAMYAEKRQRPIRRVSMATTHPLDADHAATMLGEIVPLLTSPGELNDKLQLVAHRLAVGAGYDGVHFEVLRHLSEAPAGQSAFAQVPEELVEAWNREQRQFEAHPLREIMERTRRPIILDDAQHDQRLTDAERELLRAAGLRSALLAPMFWQNELLGHLAVASKREAAFGPRDAEFLMAVATQVTAIVRMATLVEELQSTSDRLEEAHTEMVMLLAAAAEAHDRTTGQHLQNVRAIAEALAADLGHSKEQSKEIGLAAVLHDIGKVRVPDSILASVGRLSEGEWELLKRHTVWGEEFLKGRPGFELAATIARSHHERWDGSGYPDGLADEAIPEAATIVAVADSFDAITSDRPYRAARSVAAAVQEIVACSGKQFSPRVVRALVRLHKRKMLPRLHRHAPEEKAAA